MYENNRLSIDKAVDVILETFENDRSPTVAKWTTSGSRSANGIITYNLQTEDLENSSELDDPIAGD